MPYSLCRLAILLLLGIFACSAARPAGLSAPLDSTQGAEAHDPGTSAPGAAAVTGAPLASSTPDRPEHGQCKVPVSAADPQWGDVDAPVTIVEISDFQCPFCSRVRPTIEALKQQYGPRQLRLVWKHNPLPFHHEARPVHLAAAAVHMLAGNSAFYHFHDLAFANQRALTPANLQAWAAQAGVSGMALQTWLDSGKPAQKVESDLQLARDIGATGTPAFRINGVTLSGAQPVEAFQEIIDQQLIAAKLLTASGTPTRAVYAQLTDKNYVAPRAIADSANEQDLKVYNVPVFADDPVRGPKDALVTLIAFSEFQCPFCKRVEPTLAELLKLYPKELRIVWKDNPLPFHARAKPAALLAHFAHKKQGNDGFWRMHDALFANQPELEEEDFADLVKNQGLVWAQAQAALAASVSPKIDQSQELAEAFGARGTPHFFINGRRLSGAQPLAAFTSLIDEQLAVASKLAESGVPRAKVFAELMKKGEGAPEPERKQVPLRADAPARGDAKAPVVIQVFSDFQCPFCKRVEPTLAELQKELKGSIRIVWRHLPLPFHKDAQLAAEASEEVLAQKGVAAFWTYHDLLFEAQSEPDGLGRDNLIRLAVTLGVDRQRFEAALNSRVHAAKVKADAAVAGSAGINGTPAFLINDYYLSGAQPAPAFKKLVKKALKAGP
jgi:protein-disulfide isomerase